MTLRAINPPGANIPGVSQGMVIEGGKLLLLSGHVPLRNDGSVSGLTLESQLEQVFENLLSSLKAAGSDFTQVARLTIYLRDYSSEKLAIVRAVRDRFINPDKPPASALIGVNALFHPDVMVEIDAIAAIPA